MPNPSGLSGVGASSNPSPSIPSPSFPPAPSLPSLPSVLSQPAPGANFGKPFFNLDAPSTGENVAVAAAFAVAPFVIEAAFPAIAIVGAPLIAGTVVSVGAFLIGCAAGLLPSSICPRPDNPSPGGKSASFKGGQCPNIGYSIRFIVRQTENYYGTIYTSTFENQQGQFFVINDIFVAKRNGRTQLLCNCNGYNNPNSGGGDIELYSQASTLDFEILSLKIIRVDGFPDNCGDPPPKPSPQVMPNQITNISNITNNININLTVPNPFPSSPSPKKQPLVLTPPSPLPRLIYTSGNNFAGGVGLGGGSSFGGDSNYGDPGIYFNPGGGGNFNDQGDYFNNFPPSPQPNLRYPSALNNSSLPAPPPPAPLLLSLPEIPPPLPDKLPPDSTEQDKYIYRQNKETLDKVYKANSEILEIQKEQKRQSKLLENIQGLLDVEVQGSQLITRCDDIDIFYSYKGKILEAINQQLNHVKSIEQTIISEICQVEASAAVAAPDWWAVRLGGDTPQLALIFRVINTRTYHTLVVPHPINTAPLTIAPIPSYKKGNWMGMITCKDNSKFVCNCGTKGEATRVLFIAASLIDPVFLGDPVRFYYAERKGGAVGEGDMRGTSAQYFPVGQRQTKPLWRVTFTRDGQ